ncbi:uncharacterized protein LOC125947656 [Dermacentor silvarum]|uniref:uncharacterized protein LOC125947656 n=1 Tax=Dermacentor silvarum TaxID=543639 RepID=UPI00210145B6|nr:uncharacterized protein LOC125947656 [Dermacentor silvarum]
MTPSRPTPPGADAGGDAGFCLARVREIRSASATQYVRKLMSTNQPSAQPFRYFAAIAELEPTKWRQIAEDIEREMNSALIFVAETYEWNRGRRSTCLVGGTAWELPTVCGRQDMKTWIESAQAPNLPHGSVLMPALSVGATLYTKMSVANGGTLSEMRKPLNVTSQTTTRSKVCDNPDWEVLGVDDLFKQQLWKTKSGGRRARFSYATMDTPETLRDKLTFPVVSVSLVAVLLGVRLRNRRCFRESGVRLRDRERPRLRVLDLERDLPAELVALAASSASSAALCRSHCLFVTT